MKTTKGAFTTLLIIFSHIYSQAQVDIGTPAQELTAHKEEIKSTPYIFEGTVIQQHQNNCKVEVITTCIMQITKIYKGSPQLQLGSVKVITWHKLKNSFGPVEGYVVPVGIGGTYIIFGGSTNSVDSTKTDNPITLSEYGMEYPVVISDKDSVNWYGTPQFKTLNDIEAFFKENGLTVQEEKK
jgi:hypothetical protein